MAVFDYHDAAAPDSDNARLADLVDRVHHLSDTELAVLISLVAREHCVMGTPDAAVGLLVEELQLIARHVFGLASVVVDCHAGTTPEAFAAALLRPAVVDKTPSTASRKTDYFAAATAASSSSSHPPPPTDASTLPHVVIARHLNRAPVAVQIQALELLRTRRISRAATVSSSPTFPASPASAAAPSSSSPATALAAPQPFLLVAVVAAESGFRWQGCTTPRDGQDEQGHGRYPCAHFSPHLCDALALGYWHDPDDGYANLEDEGEAYQSSSGSGSDSSSSRSRSRSSHSRSSRSRSRSSHSRSSRSRSRHRSSHSRSSHSRSSHSRSSHSRSSHSRGSSSRSQHGPTHPPPPYITLADVRQLADRAAAVRVDVDVLRYEMNVAAFLRLHRGVATLEVCETGGGGNSDGNSDGNTTAAPYTHKIACPTASPASARYLETLARCLAPLHRLDYVTPALAAKAARSVYLHRIRVVGEGLGSAAWAPTTREDADDPLRQERSMQWGSQREAVAAALHGLHPEDVINDVLEALPPPV